MTAFDHEIEALISRQLDGELSAEEHQRLQEWINAEPANAQAFVEYSLLHDRLRVGAAQPEISNEEAVEVSRAGSHRPDSRWLAGRSRPYIPSKSVRWAIGAIGSTAALLIVTFLLFQVLKGTPAVAAEAQLEKLIEAARNSTDRTYLVTALESKTRNDRRVGGRRGFNQFGSPKKLERQGKNKPPVDGAILHVRGNDQYVLVRRFDNGDEFITGCDGKTSWSIAPRKGRVRVSENLDRFRGGMPGNQHSIPFINIHEDLENIRTAYEISWLDSIETTDARSGLGCLIATKRSPEQRGAKYVEIWFDVKTGIIHELFLDKLGRFKEGPESILLELINESTLPEDFFQHASHHDSNREVIRENE